MASSSRMQPRHAVFIACLLSAAAASTAGALAQVRAASAMSRKQVPADQHAFRDARNLPDPAQRVAALKAFLKAYPESVYADRSRQAMLELLLKEFPDRLQQIDEIAHAIIQTQDKGYDRWNQQMYVADELAGAGSSGVDLPVAAAWIQDTDRQLTEEHFNQAQKEIYRRYETAPPSPEELHRMYQHKRAEVLLVLAHVAIKQSRLQDAANLLDQSAALDSLNGELNYLRGEIALQQRRPAEALQMFERAHLLGELPNAQRKDMLALYRDANHGSEAGLDEELDKQYATLYPQPFEPATHTPVVAGHTALLEFYTGSACGPCVGGDLALERLLETYSRREVVALSFDEHIPLPDPLANPSSVTRADTFGVRHTPNYVLDGKVLHLFGADRTGAANLYQRMVEALDAQLVRPSGLQLTLSEGIIHQGTFTARAEVRVEPEAVLRSRTAMETAVEPEADDSEDPPEVTVGPAATDSARAPKPAESNELAPLPRPALYFALVEDHVRYSGENGVRFHRMVVRAVTRADYVTLKPGATAVTDARFNLAEVARSNASYLESYEKSNDRFGPVQFLSRDTAMQPAHLALAAWVEDTATHRVLQAAFLPFPAAPAATVLSTAKTGESQ